MFFQHIILYIVRTVTIYTISKVKHTSHRLYQRSNE
jgi:hypothetical protein